MIESIRQTTPTEWQSFSERNVQEASEQVHRSLQLRVTAMAVMQDIIRDTRSHANQVDQLFHDVIDRTRKALGALRSEHNAVCQQIQETEETASQLRAAIAAQDAPLGSAIQQLARRTARPNVEFCRLHYKRMMAVDSGWNDSIFSCKGMVFRTAWKFGSMSSERRYVNFKKNSAR